MLFKTYHGALAAALREIGMGHVDADVLIERAKLDGVRPIPGAVSCPVHRSINWGRGGRPFIEYQVVADELPKLKELVARYMAAPAEPAPQNAA